MGAQIRRKPKPRLTLRGSPLAQSTRKRCPASRPGSALTCPQGRSCAFPLPPPASEKPSRASTDRKAHLLPKASGGGVGEGSYGGKRRPLLSQCGETGAYGHNQHLKEALRRPPLAARGGYPKPRVEGWGLKKVWDLGSRNRLTQRDSGRQNGWGQKMRGKGIT